MREGDFKFFTPRMLVGWLIASEIGSDWLGLREMDWPSRSAGAKLLVDFKADIDAMNGKYKQTLLMKAGFSHVQTMRCSEFMLSTSEMYGFIDVMKCHESN